MESLLFFTTLPERVVVIWPLTQFCWQGFLTALLLSILHDTATANAIVHSAPLSRSGVIPSAALLRHTLASHSTAPFVWRASFIDSCASGCCCRPPVWTQRPKRKQLEQVCQVRRTSSGTDCPSRKVYATAYATSEKCARQAGPAQESFQGSWEGPAAEDFLFIPVHIWSALCITHIFYHSRLESSLFFTTLA